MMVHGTTRTARQHKKMLLMQKNTELQSKKKKKEMRMSIYLYNSRIHSFPFHFIFCTTLSEELKKCQFSVTIFHRRRIVLKATDANRCKFEIEPVPQKLPYKKHLFFKSKYVYVTMQCWKTHYDSVSVTNFNISFHNSDQNQKCKLTFQLNILILLLLSVIQFFECILLYFLMFKQDRTVVFNFILHFI